MKYSYAANAHSIQIEISTKCNAQCPACIRTDSTSLAGTQTIIPRNQEMPVERFTQIFSSAFTKKLNIIEFCGTLDEPLMHSQFFEILDVIHRLNPLVSVKIHTNAGLRNEEYFSKLAQKLQRFGSSSCVKFSLDGLEDTNSIYRYGVDFQRAIRNLKAFTTAGGKAEWQMLIFPWNQHQIEAAKNMAQSLGCVAFKARPDRTMTSSWGAEKIISLRSQKLEPLGHLRKGDSSSLSFIEDNRGRSVSCVYREERNMIFISWDAQVWPCCFWTNIRYENEIKKNLLEQTVYSKYGKDFNSLKHHSLDEILDHPFFAHDLVKSWEENSLLKWRCVDKCSVARLRSSDGKVDDKKPYSYEEFNRQ